MATTTLIHVHRPLWKSKSGNRPPTLWRRWGCLSPMPCASFWRVSLRSSGSRLRFWSRTQKRRDGRPVPRAALALPVLTGCSMISKRPRGRKQAILSRASDHTKVFAKAWKRLSRSGRFDLKAGWRACPTGWARAIQRCGSRMECVHRPAQNHRTHRILRPLPNRPDSLPAESGPPNSAVRRYFYLVRPDKASCCVTPRSMSCPPRRFPTRLTQHVKSSGQNAK